ncbi:hypothetical protein F9C28_17615 [Shimwellia pseudoproteus]|uniref:hypothetical protein n=1 Tax=Shimwellia pseudoproteus TaxID=570012 RepID=UPI0018EBE041|nr:hypothetical protein [Shimwellia pseudoproteus]MBJ3816680.1 hypothetical protein [Shimwellia pseudoproteus]
MKDVDTRRHGRGHGHRRIAKPVAIGVALIVVLGLLVMSLWNAVLPGLIGVKNIGFWQALGLLALCRILFGGLGMRPGMFGARRRMHERWMQMTPEQREQFMQHRHKHRWHGVARLHGGHYARDGQHEHQEDAPTAEPQPEETNAQKSAGTE